MKFGQTYQERLREDGFPQHWVENAISYKQLKKCIKRVEKELSDIGLDASTLKQLLEHEERESSTDSDGQEDGEPFQYLLADPTAAANGEAATPMVVFRPKLLIAADKQTGEPIAASLSPETKDYLHKLALTQRMTDVRVTELPDSESTGESASLIASNTDLSPAALSSLAKDASQAADRGLRMVEVPLTSDSEFFSTLQSSLSGLATLRQQEEKRLQGEVIRLGQEIANITEPKGRKNRHDLAQWRKIFELYLEQNIFFSTNELDHGARDSAEAEVRLRAFSDALKKQPEWTKFRRKGSSPALDRFVQLNLDLLQHLRFQEINQMAMQKILKKFDKRTALGVKRNFPTSIEATVFTQSLAKNICFELSTELLSVVPQLSDYLCPVCFSISFRPVRLRCGHIFCVRCLIVMQRAREDHCPLCRSSVVMEADSTSVDPELTKFLIKYFPNEVKVKQKENEHAAGVDEYGEAYNEKCTVM
ncbi:hypothetical protein W97_06151 [Coniosporium apollinis CBS 100218]|uniref:RING-14 protein n=1 Tax=Coniosporium apollinis (strain CBS 100218) TaxID=1168221 RepID=R7YZ17_CONA1|nr:uncharacterized protein W97_06151 [Coniosporium apollinis CBS 100218]EON67034.1 hypothetical protein W97_06151 [Coniosporium apollinis CBS 100218]